MRKIVLFVLIAFSAYAEKTTLLFHLHDAGETYALIPVIRQLDEEDYLVIASGVACRLLEELPKNRIRTLEDREKIEPRKVLTGVADDLQGETLDFFRSRALTYAFWDNFNTEGPSAYFSRAHRIQEKADVLLLPCESLLTSFSHRKSFVVGHPALPEPTKPKLVVWIGGYGENYEEAHALFKEGMKSVVGCVVLEQYHPKTGLKNDLKTSDAIALADLVVCHQTSAAFQALAQNKPVLHVIPEGQEFESIPIEKGLAKKVTLLKEFSEKLTEAMNGDVSGFYEVMGIPKNSVDLICQSLGLECYN